jgi:hypothetical protein
MRWQWMILCIGSAVAELRAVNTYGLETELAYECGLSCCWIKPNEYYIEKASAMGFNSIRLPFSAEYINKGDFRLMDSVISKACSLNMTVVLDYHRTWSGHQGNWYETNIDDFVDVWHRILYRYYEYPLVRYADLFNEFQDGNDKASFWNDIMTESILRLDTIFPGRWHYFVGGTNWGGNLNGIRVRVPDDVSERVSYTVHKYSFSMSGDYRHDYDVSFGGHPPEKLFIGEFGWIQSDDKQRQWGKMFLDYLKEKNIRNTAFWCLSWFSHDTEGMLKQNCIDVEEEKLNMLKNFWS